MGNHTGVSPKSPNKYLGPNVYQVLCVTRNRAPTGSDVFQPETGKYYPFSSIWVVGKDPTTGIQGDLWILGKIVANVAFWTQISAGTGTLVQLAVPTGSSPVSPDGMGIITFTSTGGTLSINGTGSNTINFEVIDSGLPWHNVTATSATMVSDNGYQPNNAGLVTLTMPSIVSSTFGDTIKVSGFGAGGWLIQCVGGQTIHYGSSSTISGGSLASTNQYDAIELVCSSTTSQWLVRNSEGNLTVV